MEADVNQGNFGPTKRLQLSDCRCPICMYIYIEPVTMPCGHELCMACFRANVQESSLTCPMCRTRISSWARRAGRHQKLVNERRWLEIKEAFPEKVANRLEGREDDGYSSDEEEYVNVPMVAEPGEIRREYEEQLRKLEEEREAQRQLEDEASAGLIQELREEEDRRQRQEIQDQEVANDLSQALNQKTPDDKQSTKKSTPTLLDKFVKRVGREAKGSSNSSPGWAPDDLYPYPCLTPADKGGGKGESRPESSYSDIFTRPGSRNSSVSTVDYVYVGSRNNSVLDDGGGDDDLGILAQVKLEEEQDMDGFPIVMDEDSPLMGTSSTAMHKMNRHVQFSSPYKVFQPEAATTSHPASISDAVGSDRQVSPRSDSVRSEDSISPELVHFRPIDSSPRTPPRRLTSGRAVHPPVIKSTPRNLRSFGPGDETGAGDGGDLLNPARVTSSTSMRNTLYAMAAQKQALVNSMSKATWTKADKATSYFSPKKRVLHQSLYGKMASESCFSSPSQMLASFNQAATATKDMIKTVPRKRKVHEPADDCPVLLPILPLDPDLEIICVEIPNISMKQAPQPGSSSASDTSSCSTSSSLHLVPPPSFLPSSTGADVAAPVLAGISDGPRKAVAVTAESIRRALSDDGSPGKGKGQGDVKPNGVIRSPGKVYRMKKLVNGKLSLGGGEVLPCGSAAVAPSHIPSVTEESKASMLSATDNVFQSSSSTVAAENGKIMDQLNTVTTADVLASDRDGKKQYLAAEQLRQDVETRTFVGGAGYVSLDEKDGEYTPAMVTEASSGARAVSEQRGRTLEEQEEHHHHHPHRKESPFVRTTSELPSVDEANTVQGQMGKTHPAKKRNAGRRGGTVPGGRASTTHEHGPRAASRTSSKADSASRSRSRDDKTSGATSTIQDDKENSMDLNIRGEDVGGSQKETIVRGTASGARVNGRTDPEEGCSPTKRRKRGRPAKYSPGIEQLMPNHAHKTKGKVKHITGKSAQPSGMIQTRLRFARIVDSGDEFQESKQTLPSTGSKSSGKFAAKETPAKAAQAHLSWTNNKSKAKPQKVNPDEHSDGILSDNKDLDSGSDPDLTNVAAEAEMEELDRLLAMRIQADYDAEVKYNLTAIRRKGTDGQYSLRQAEVTHGKLKKNMDTLGVSNKGPKSAVESRKRPRGRRKKCV